MGIVTRSINEQAQAFHVVFVPLFYDSYFFSWCLERVCVTWRKVGIHQACAQACQGADTLCSTMGMDRGNPKRE